MDYEVEAITPHPEYGKKQDNAAPHDICILRLATDVEFTNELRPICLPLELDIQKLPIVGETFTVTGWGETENIRWCTMKWLVCSIVTLSLILVADAEELSNGDACETPNGTPGICQLMRNCSYVKQMVKSANFSHNDTTYLQLLICGEMIVPMRKKPIPLVCCPKLSNTELCGAQSLVDRIYDGGGGGETKRSKHPWAALLFYNIGRNRVLPKCGGALVSARYVITAAHCTVDKPNWKLLYARFNEFNASSTDNCTILDDNSEFCRMDYEVEAIIPHPEYDKNNVSRPNDICILRLAIDVEFTDELRPICLPLEQDVQTLPIIGETFTVTGWGETEKKRPCDIQLHVDLPGLDNEACNSVCDVDNVTLNDRQLCIGGLSGTDSCRGDSGGPLMRNEAGVWYLIGVLSFGARMRGTENLPARVWSLVEWYTMKWLVCSIVTLSLILVADAEELSNGDACITPNGTQGICQPVRNCSYVQKILKSADFSHYDTTYLQELKCGEMILPMRKKPIPLVCCPKLNNTELCGAQSLADRIYFGEETKRGEYPWAALLFYNIGRNRVLPKCGGALVSARYVITAAHCTVDKPNWKLLYARFNEFNASSTDNCTILDDNSEFCRVDYEVEAIIPHPEYDKNNVSRPNDICILRLATDVEFTDELRPICLPLELEVQKLPIINETFTVTGWGETENKRPSDIQLHVDLPGLDNEACNSVYVVANVTLTDRQLCIGGLNGTDSCRGDSGGPLMRNAFGAWHLFGVVSFGARMCGTENLPGVYTNIVQYIDWLEEVMLVQQYL
uniref:CLIP domain-containing serine protease n=1 Tax=Anopheles dirus TaxID=7168 RepID=A0A182NC16_9DIPT